MTLKDDSKVTSNKSPPTRPQNKQANMIRYTSTGKRFKVNLIDYMLGFTREKELRQMLKDVRHSRIVGSIRRSLLCYPNTFAGLRCLSTPTGKAHPT